MRKLPYPGHSWAFTQHAVHFKATTLYTFLKCVLPFEGLSASAHAKKITQLVLREEILTSNERDGIASSWRDYQQVLAEIGLICSTNVCPHLLITEAGHSLLAGEIGFAELMGAQALRYQYPNGQKSAIQSRLAEALSAARISRPDSLIELQAQNGILIKPAVLILRILVELGMKGRVPELTVDECLRHLLPCRKNSEWEIALREIEKARDSGVAEDAAAYGRRNIQDWFKFLAATDLFRIVGGAIALSEKASAQLQVLRQICAEQEDPGSFWIPNAADRQGWFRWYGQLPLDVQQVMQVPDRDADYVRRNYPAGIDEDEEDVHMGAGSRDLALDAVDLERLRSRAPLNFARVGDLDVLAEKLKVSAQKRHSKTVLHDRIVAELAETFQKQGATVQEDPDSVDLLVSWPTVGKALFEVKTVTKLSLQSRLRAGVGQVQEYAYRYSLAAPGVVDRVLVINAGLKESAWQVDFLRNYLDIGLICRPASGFTSFPPDSAQTRRYWTFA